MNATLDHPVPASAPGSASTAPRANDAPARPSDRFRMPRVRMEARKLMDTRAPRVLTGLALLAGALMAILFPLFTREPMTPSDITTAALSVAMYVVPVVAILTVTAEWGKNATGLVTFTLDPKRTAVLAAKAVACVALAAVLVVAAYLVATLGAAVSGTEFGAVGPWLAGAGWRVAGLGGLMILAGALGAATQSTVMAIVAYLLLPQLVPQVLSIFDATSGVAPYVDVQLGLLGMLAGQGPQDWVTFGTAAAVWIGVPAVIGVWRGARGNVG